MIEFNIGLYSYKIRFFVDKSEFSEKTGFDKSEFHYATTYIRGQTVSIFVPDDFKSYTDPDFLRCLSHESTHAAMHILSMSGVNYDFENQEALCYLQDYIFSECYKGILKREHLKGLDVKSNKLTNN